MLETSTPPAVPHPSDAQRIYNVLFAGTIPPMLRVRFDKAWRILDPDYSEEERAMYRRAVSGAGDLEALEFALRRAKRVRMLSDQVVLMSFLAETLPSHYRDYVDSRAGRLKGFTLMAMAVLQSAVKYVQGLYLRWRLYV